MKSTFYNQIVNSNAHRWQRDLNRDMALADEGHLLELFELAFDLSDKNHFKACWALELVLEQNLELILPHLDSFCNIISEYQLDPAIRPISKICLFISKSKTIELTEKQEQQLIETCLDWLIQDEKVAGKAYSMRALLNFSKKHIWMIPELQTILSQDYPNHSAAYKAAAKDVLRKLAKEKLK